MSSFNLNKRGAALFMVLATLLIVVVLANVILNLMLSQSRLTHHQVSRIQAYYAAQAGMNLAMENLRTGTWGMGSYSLCRSGCDVTDSDIPYPVTITIGARINDPSSPFNGTYPINITTNYTYILP